MSTAKINRLPFWLVVTAVLLGAFLRLHDLASLPISAGFDVAYYGLDALQILRGDLPVYFASNFGREALFSYLVAALYAGLGLSDFAIHLAAAFAGILTIPATYIVAKELLRSVPWPVVRRYGPVLAAFVLSFMYWHLVWSRYGVRAILAPLFIALTMFFLLRAQRTGQRRLYLLAGLGAGLGLHTYQVGQLLPLLVVGVVIIDLWSRRKRVQLSAYLRPLLPMLLGFLALALPLGLYATRHPESFNQRVRDVAIVEATQPLAEQWIALASRAAALARFFTVQGDAHKMWSVGRLPGLNPFLLLGFVLGLWALLWFWRRRWAQIMGLWLIVMLTPALLADSGTVSKRALGVLPVLAALIALGFGSLLVWLRGRAPDARLWPAAAAVLLGGGFLFTFVDTYTEYFVLWGQDAVKDGHFEPQLSEVGSYIATLPQDERIYLSADAPNHPNMLLHSRLRSADDTLRGYNGWRCFVYPGMTTEPTTYVLSDEPSITNVQAAFPRGALQDENLSDYYGFGDYYVAYHIPAGEQAELVPQVMVHDAVWGDDQIALLGYDLSAQSVVPGDRLTVTLYWQALRPSDTRYTAFVHLLGPTNPANGTPIWGQQDSEPCKGYYPTAVWRAGEIIRDDMVIEVGADTPPGSYELTTGLYTWPDFERLPIGDSDVFTLQTIPVR
jgi:4-amino-4-deoxy-L-arabinose transferase-like glycosyltransferase